MPVDQSLVGREFPPTQPYRVSAEKVRELARRGSRPGPTRGQVPATFPIVMAFEAMNAFLADVGVELHRIVHGEQRFSYERPIAVGDELTATLGGRLAASDRRQRHHRHPQRDPRRERRPRLHDDGHPGAPRR